MSTIQNEKIHDDEIGYYYVTTKAHDENKQLSQTTSFYVFVLEEKNVSLERFNKFAEDNLNRSCHCEFDCCGHWFTRVNHVLRLDDESFLVMTSSARNY